MIEKDIIEKCREIIKNELGTLDDIPYELANTIANIYYRFFMLTEKIVSSKSLNDFLSEREDILVSLQEISNEINFLLTSVQLIPQYIKNLRNIDKERQPNLYRLFVNIYLDDLKYNIKNPFNKTGIRRKIERFFKRNKVKEIPNLIEIIYSDEFNFNKNNTNSLNSEKNRNYIFYFSLSLITISIISILFSLIQYYHEELNGISFQIGKIIGYSIWIIIITELIWRILFKKKFKIKLLLFSILFFCVSIYQSYIILNELREAKLITKKTLESIENYLKDKKSNSTSGELSQFSKIFNDYLINLKRQNELFRNKLEQIIYFNLKIENFNNKNKLLLAKNNLKNVENIINEYKQNIESIDNSFIEKINLLNINSKIKKEFIIGFNESKKERYIYLNRYFEIIRSLVFQLDILLDFLISKQGKFQILDGQLMFYSEKDVENFNKYLKKIMLISEQEKKLLNEYNQKTVNKFNDIVKLID